MKIEHSNWKDFLMGDLFEGTTTGNILARDVEYGSGSTPFVTSSGVNNGVVGYIDASKYDIIQGHCVLVGGKTFTLTYQQEDFVSNDSHNIVLRLKNRKAPAQVYLFLISVIRVSLSARYEWSDAVTKEKLLKNYIKLPAKGSEPDWDYMINYIERVTKNANTNLNHLISMVYPDGGGPISDVSWKRFVLEDLFDVIPGDRLRKQDMKSGDINYVGASAFNNGVTAKIGNTEHLHPAGVITVCYNGSVGRAFYQTKTFWATDDVNVLYPKFALTENIALFFIPVLYKISLVYAFTDKWTAEKMRKSEIPLPVTNDGKPDWNYMEQFISILSARAQKIIISIN